MEYRVLGQTGMRVSELCLGTMYYGWTADEATSFDVLTTAYAGGVNFLDTANIYTRYIPGNVGGESETIIGKWIKSGVARREEMVIATKVRGPMGPGPNDWGLSRRHVIEACHASLKRLQTDYIDLYLLHWWDDTTAIEETLSALDDLVRAGNVRYIGFSHYPAWRVMEGLWTSDVRRLVRCVCLEPHYNLVQREEYERELEPVAVKYGLGVIPYSPLAEGFLTGKYKRSDSLPDKGRMQRSRYNMHAVMSDPRNWDIVEALERLGKERGKTISQMAIGWTLSRPSITSPIIGPRTKEQMLDNLGAVGIRMTSEELAVLEAVGDWKRRRWDEGQFDEGRPVAH